MKTVIEQRGNPGIAREHAFPAINTTGPSLIALSSAIDPETVLWRQAIDQMLHWRSMRAKAVVLEDDMPAPEIVDTAIDFAYDQLNSDTGASAPDSVVPSGAGRIAMEWNGGGETQIIEFTGSGVATYTIFNIEGKIAQRGFLQRNPHSRQMELRGVGQDVNQHNS